MPQISLAMQSLPAYIWGNHMLSLMLAKFLAQARPLACISFGYARFFCACFREMPVLLHSEEDAFGHAASLKNLLSYACAQLKRFWLLGQHASDSFGNAKFACLHLGQS